MLVEHVVFSLRIRARLSQHDVAKRANFSPAYICMIESGERIPSPRAAPRLERALGDTDHTITQAILADTGRLRSRCALVLWWLCAGLGLS